MWTDRIMKDYILSWMEFPKGEICEVRIYVKATGITYKSTNPKYIEQVKEYIKK